MSLEILALDVDDNPIYEHDLVIAVEDFIENDKRTFFLEGEQLTTMLGSYRMQNGVMMGKDLYPGFVNFSRVVTDTWIDWQYEGHPSYTITPGFKCEMIRKAFAKTKNIYTILPSGEWGYMEVSNG